MLFKNEKKERIKVRIEESRPLGGQPNYGWRTVKPGDTIELDICKKIGKSYGLTFVNPEIKSVKAVKILKSKKVIKSVEDEKILEPEEVLDEEITENKDEKGKYSKTSLVDKTKEEQVIILKKFGVSEEDIKKLKNEESRVNAILKLQE